MLSKLFFVVFLILGMAYSGHSQNFQWIKQVGDKQLDNDSKCNILPDGQSVISWHYAEFTKIDAFRLESQKFTSPSVISFLNKQGKAKWVWKPDSCASSFNVSAITYSESIGKIFVCGNFSKKATINKVTYTAERNGFIIRLDTTGTFEKIYTLSNSGAFSFETMDITDNNEIILGVNLYNFNSQISIPEVGFLTTKSCYFILKLDKDLVPIKVSEPAYGNRLGRLTINLTSNNTILNSYTFIDTAIIDGKIYFNGNGIRSTYFTYLDINLKIKKNALIFTSKDNFPLINTLKTLNNGGVLIGGVFSDSISLKPQEYFYSTHVPLFACIDSNLKLKWMITPEIRKGEFIRGEIIDIDVCGEYIYAGGYFLGDANYNEFRLPKSDGIFWFFKTDSRGNILWMNKIGTSNYYQYISSISTNEQGEILLSGLIVDTVKLNNQSYITEKGKSDILLMKIQDIEIIRGFVNPGPYCAGDTIKIPYTKNGSFNTGNQFIAQLSDEEGNFTGKERELGRLASTENGLIKGLLPLFDLVSSPNYRIRIISTNPVVQSYYKYDTLRLLIYSKDTANAGKDTTICNGQSVKLTTTGGSRWRWSPGELVKDSTAKTTLAVPNVTTKYRIIISDSSGCGKIDTAYKTITVRPPLRILGLPTDLVICKNSRTNLKIIPSGGLGTHYNFQWLTSKSEQLRNTDTISLIADSISSLKAILSDGCSAKNDTLEITFSLPDFPFTQILKDTLVCQNSQPILKLIPSAGLNTDFTYQWLSLTNQLLRNTDTLTYKVVANEILKGVLVHKCSGQSDTSFIKLNVPQPIQTKIEKPTCFNSNITLKITGTGGYKNTLTHQWNKNNITIGTGETINLTDINNKQKIAVITSDYCQTIIKDSISLFPNPAAKLVSNVDSICQFQPVTLFNQSNSFAPLSTKLTWLTYQKTWKNKDTVLTFSETGNKKIKIEITDSLGCIASDEINVMVIEKPNAEFVTIPENPSADHGTFELIPIETGYKKYNWTIGNLTLNHSNWQKVRLPITDTITYLTSLKVSNYFGCIDTVTKNIRIGVSDAFYIPNAVSRNDDGLNDEFAPYGWKILSYEMLIVARTNQVVYKGNTPWKPTFEFGAYSYIIKVKFKDGTENSFKGHVHVIN